MQHTTVELRLCHWFPDCFVTVKADFIFIALSCLDQDPISESATNVRDNVVERGESLSDSLSHLKNDFPRKPCLACNKLF